MRKWTMLCARCGDWPSTNVCTAACDRRGAYARPLCASAATPHSALGVQCVGQRHPTMSRPMRPVRVLRLAVHVQRRRGARPHEQRLPLLYAYAATPPSALGVQCVCKRHPTMSRPTRTVRVLRLTVRVQTRCGAGPHGVLRRPLCLYVPQSDGGMPTLCMSSLT